MTTIGPYRILPTQRLIIHDQERCETTFYNGEESIRVVLLLEQDVTDTEKSRIRLQGKGDHAIITLINWDRPLGSSTKEPFRLGVTDEGEGIFMMLACSSLGNTQKIDLQMMLKGEDNDQS